MCHSLRGWWGHTDVQHSLLYASRDPKLNNGEDFRDRWGPWASGTPRAATPPPTPPSLGWVWPESEVTTWLLASHLSCPQFPDLQIGIREIVLNRHSQAFRDNTEVSRAPFSRQTVKVRGESMGKGKCVQLLRFAWKRLPFPAVQTLSHLLLSSSYCRGQSFLCKHSYADWSGN